MLLRRTVKTRRDLTSGLMNKFVEAVERDDPNSELYQAEWEAGEKALERLEATLLRKEAELGVDESDELERLSDSEYARDVMNARALKLRLRERLRARKFEFDPVERTCRRLATGKSYLIRRTIRKIMSNTDDKLRAHTESAIKRREPTIAKIAAEYNKLCAKIVKLIAGGEAPRGAIAPLPIPAKGLWQLEVDDAIFQDVGLYERDDVGAPPLWLCDEKVRAGIKAVLELDRCGEEDARLRRETLALRVWFGEEWEVVVRAIGEAGKFSFSPTDLNLMGSYRVRRRQIPPPAASRQACTLVRDMGQASARLWGGDGPTAAMGTFAFVAVGVSCRRAQCRSGGGQTL